MITEKGSEPAFPNLFAQWNIDGGQAGPGPDHGLTKRELLAAIAMNKFDSDEPPWRCARFSVRFADALLLELYPKPAQYSRVEDLADHVLESDRLKNLIYEYANGHAEAKDLGFVIERIFEDMEESLDSQKRIERAKGPREP